MGSFGTGDGQFANPKGIATDGKTVYVADDPRFDIQAFDTNGGFAFIPVPVRSVQPRPDRTSVHGRRDRALEVDGRQAGHPLDLDFAALAVSRRKRT
jgi:hypothetical protein